MLSALSQVRPQFHTIEKIEKTVKESQEPNKSDKSDLLENAKTILGG